MKKLVCIIISILIIVLSFSACGNSTYSLSVEIENMPQNIDPQLASSDTELMIVRNTFEGLMRTDKDGKTVLGIADGYEISADKKTYTFTINKNAKWSDGRNLTANDFEFALKRAANPVTASPHSDLLRNIKGVSAALSKKSSYQDIGVIAENDHTLKIILNSADENFLDKLTKSVFMPCNEDYFVSCKGKYGLNINNIIFNGTYEIGQWNNEGNSVKLIIHQNYGGNFKAGPSKIWLEIPDEDEKNTRPQRVASESIDLARLDYNDISKAELEDIKVTNIYNSSYAIVFNSNTSVGKNSKLLCSFATSIDKNELEKAVPENFNTTYSIVPSVCKVSSKPASEVFKGNNKFTYSPKSARELFLESLKEFPDESFPTFSVLCEDNEIIKNILANAVSYWQQNLGAYISIETVPSEDLQKRILNGDYTAAFVSVTAKDEYAYDFLSCFKTGYSQNIINYSNSEFDNLLSEKHKNNESKLKSAEKILLNSATVIPICEAPTIFSTPKNIKGAVFSIYNGIVDFSFIYRED